MNPIRPYRVRNYDIDFYVDDKSAVKAVKKHLNRPMITRCNCHPRGVRGVNRFRVMQNGRGLRVTGSVLRGQHGNFPSDVEQDLKTAPVGVRRIIVRPADPPRGGSVWR